MFKVYAQGYSLPFLGDLSQLQRGFETAEVNEGVGMDKCTHVTPTWSAPGPSAQQEHPLGGDIGNSSNVFTNPSTTSSFTGFLLKSDEKFSKHITEELDSESYHT